MFLHDYFRSLRLHLEKLEDYGYTETIEISEEIRPTKQAIINARIIMINGSELQIKEYIDGRGQANFSLIIVSNIVSVRIWN